MSRESVQSPTRLDHSPRQAQLIAIGWHDADLLKAIEPHLLAAIDSNQETEWTLADVLECAQKGVVQLWAIMAIDGIIGAGATMLTQTTKRTVLEIITFGALDGRAEEWLYLIDRLRLIARSWGCEAIQLHGRPGWTRRLTGLVERRFWELPTGNQPLED